MRNKDKYVKKYFNKKSIKKYIFDKEGRPSRRFLAMLELLIFLSTMIGSKSFSTRREPSQEADTYIDLPDQNGNKKNTMLSPILQLEFIETAFDEIKQYKEDAKTDIKTVLVDENVVSLEMQRQDILNDRGWTDEILDKAIAIALAESKALSYEDAYAVMSVPINRTNSVAWNYSVDLEFGEGAGRDVYYQMIQPGQFSVYTSGSYKNFLPGVFPGDLKGYEEYSSVRELPGYKAVLDCLSSNEPMHDYLNFVGAGFDSDGKERFVNGGNLYYNRLKEKDKIQTNDEKVLTLTPNSKK